MVRQGRWTKRRRSNTSETTEYSDSRSRFTTNHDTRLDLIVIPPSLAPLTLRVPCFTSPSVCVHVERVFGWRILLPASCDAIRGRSVLAAYIYSHLRCASLQLPLDWHLQPRHRASQRWGQQRGTTEQSKHCVRERNCSAAGDWTEISLSRFCNICDVAKDS